jgi:SNF2 family DNA or RNA helicase
MTDPVEVELRPLWSGFSYLDHQVLGVQWMLSKEIEGTEWNGKQFFGGLQCDDMGLGKTIQMAGTMLNNYKARSLLIVPLAMIETWQNVMMQVGFNVFVIEKRLWSAVSKIRARKPCVYITNYEKILHQPSLLIGEDVTWDRVILDESHKIRNPNGALFKEIMKIVAPIRWAMSGTPLVNTERDVATQMAFIGVSMEFPAWSRDYTRLLPSIMIHRSLDSLRAYLPSAPPVPIVEEKVLEFGSADERRIYRAIQGEIRASRVKRYERDIATSKIKMILRLRQASIHPQIYINSMRLSDPEYSREDWSSPPTKFSQLRNIINEELVHDPTHKYLVFCQFHDEMELLKTYLLSEGVVTGIEMYHGGMSHSERSKTLERAKSEDCQVLLIQIHSGGVGLNLQEFDRCIFLSPWWTAALMEQAIARAVRMGQKRTVRVIHLVMAEEKTMNIDRLIGGRIAQKKAALEAVFHWATLG